VDGWSGGFCQLTVELFKPYQAACSRLSGGVGGGGPVDPVGDAEHRAGPGGPDVLVVELGFRLDQWDLQEATGSARIRSESRYLMPVVAIELTKYRWPARKINKTGS